MQRRHSRRRKASVFLCLALAFIPACNKRPVTAQKLAILRFENLGADPGDDWLGRAFSEILTESLSADAALQVVPLMRLQAAGQALGPRPVSAPGISAGAAPAIAAGATRLVYGEYTVRGATLDATMTVGDAQTGKTVSVFSASGPSSDLFTVARELASSLSQHPGKFATQNAAALRGWISAQESTDAPAIERDLEQAVAADPDFAPPYRALAEIHVRRRDLPGAVALLESALARGPSLAPAERARIAAELATFRNDAVARDRALDELAELTPGDPSVRRTQAAAAMARHDYAKAAESFRQLAELEPQEPNNWKQLGYSAAWAGDRNAALDALKRYQSLRPADADPIDCQGDVNFILNRLPEAEALYLQASQKDPNFLASLDLFKAAFAHLMTGDIPGADGIFARYSAARSAAKDPLLESRQAEWDFAAGRRKPACVRLEEHARANESGPLRELASHDYAQLAVWYLALGDRPAALRVADRAIATASRATAVSAYLARLFSEPSATAAEWGVRADRLLQNATAPQLKRFALAGALFFDRKFEAAVPVVEQLEQAESILNDPVLPLLRAWTLVETGHPKDAAAFLRWNPVPQPAGFGAYWVLAFPRIFYLRAVVAASEGKSDEAKAQYRIFLQLSGPDPLQWGEEAKASKLISLLPVNIGQPPTHRASANSL